MFAFSGFLFAVTLTVVSAGMNNFPNFTFFASETRMLALGLKCKFYAKLFGLGLQKSHTDAQLLCLSVPPCVLTPIQNLQIFTVVILCSCLLA